MPKDTSSTFGGPKMRALSEQQRVFVKEWFVHGGHLAKSARAAGYGTATSSHAYLSMQGHRVRTNPKVQAAIMEWAETGMKTEQLAIAANLITDFMQDSAIDPALRAKLALAIYNRTGLHEKSEHHQ